MADSRASRLNKHFLTIINGKQDITPTNHKLFIESVCASADPAGNINKILSSEKGIASIQKSLWFDLTPAFLNGPATELIRYISSSEASNIGGGLFLQRLLLAIVDPPFFWDTFKNAFQSNQLSQDAQLCFAWMLLQLISFSHDELSTYKETARDPKITEPLYSANRHDIQVIANKIKYMTAMLSQKAAVDISVHGPGGRHDNDFVDFHEISILPTADELLSEEASFIRPSNMLEDPATLTTRVGTHLDNQFRLLREDMINEMKEELQIMAGKIKKKQRGFKIDGLEVEDIYYGTPSRKCKWGIAFKCVEDPFKNIKPTAKDRAAHLKDHPNLFRNQTMACLIIDNDIVAFPSIHRDETLLTKIPPVIVLQFNDQKVVDKTLLRLHGANHIRLFSIDTAIFSYEPILKALQEKMHIPLSSELLFWSDGSEIFPPPSQPLQLIQCLNSKPSQDLQLYLDTSKSIKLDKAQAASFLTGLTQRVSLIQGPPGTGKSFIGALLAKAIHKYSDQIILVVCFTNHALDQFLEDLMDIGIPDSCMVRLGAKSTERTKHLALQGQSKGVRLTGFDHRMIDSRRAESDNLASRMVDVFNEYKRFNLHKNHAMILEHLEFDHAEYYRAFLVPKSSDGMQIAGRDGRAISSDYLIQRWLHGDNAGVFQDIPSIQESEDIWNMHIDARKAQSAIWSDEIMMGLVERVRTAAEEYNVCQTEIDRLFSEKDVILLKEKRIIACTTTGAAKYREAIAEARPNVLLVEEAGEILESHIITALGPHTTQMILIGDHQQLRPKVNHYALTVEKGDGYDLNRSLFERLVLKGYPHQKLITQHRMRPEISALVRALAYKDLTDAPSTKNRSNLRGVKDNIVFINHAMPEGEDSEIGDKRDLAAKSSKLNKHEALMVLKIVRYLAQQGYGTDKMIILTPYLGQLRHLREILKKENDPILNDLDSYDLIKAGLLTAAAAGIAKRPIRLSTIDNYQGEESDIVIISMTRSNPAHVIGFMSSQERLTVLLSRARDALIMIGNANTFMHSKKGSEVWKRLFGILKSNGHIYDGLPIQCERHPRRNAILKSPKQFDDECPDGGCLQPCSAVLNCNNLHMCPLKCHQISDHSKMVCEVVMHTKCSNGHEQRWRCAKGLPAACNKCDDEKRRAEKKKRQEFEHQEKLVELDAEIAKQVEIQRDAQAAEERENAILQKQKDLEDARVMAAQASKWNILPLIKSVFYSPQSTNQESAPQAVIGSILRNPPTSPSTAQQSSAQMGTDISHTSPSTPPTKGHAVATNTFSSPLRSPAREDWVRRKRMDGDSNDAIDKIMEMTGLENVKSQVLKIKDKIATSIRQNSNIKNERFNVSMLGNPGTGKTTIARHYGKFLASVQAIPGSMFVETTGSKMAQDGVAGAKKQLEDILNAGGGTMFIDEAYQLASQHNFQGSQVLDFLLAEMENNVGKIVFIFAGYNKEMEKFFEHNPGLPSRVPYCLQFNDYEDNELMDLLENEVHNMWKGRMKVEGVDGIKGLYGRIAIRRLGRGRKAPGFGNARSLTNLLAKIRERQADRLAKERALGRRPDDFLLSKEDLIGPDPSKVMRESKAWKELKTLIGLNSIKKTVENIFRMIQSNYDRELKELKPTDISLNRVFLGSPGTGKTTVAKLYGQILADLGLISNGEVVIKNPADFIGSALGQSETQTKGILAATLGKVLVIDEAYMLYGGGGNTDSYKTAVIDTIVAEIQSVPGEDRCVLLLGYKNQIEEMFQNVNPGLARRFAIESAFHFHDYSDSELAQALDLKLKNTDLLATDHAKTVALEVLSRARNRPNFGNIGAVENLLNEAKMRYQDRQGKLPVNKQSPDAPFEPVDFDPSYNRSKDAAANLANLFSDVVGSEDVVKKLSGWQTMAENMKKRNRDPRVTVPTTFIFKGPPGTGKTTTARKMGQVYYDMGFLSSIEVIECSATDLVGQYVGQTGPKTQKLFDKALGRVLFIDEAYRLSEGHFAKEAVDELVGILTQERYRGKLIVILAGYDGEMNDLLRVNPGLSSRFPNEILFKNMSPEQCLRILKHKLRQHDMRLAILDDAGCPEYIQLLELFTQMSNLKSWGNARDVETLSKQMAEIVFSIPLPLDQSIANSNEFFVPPKEAIGCVEGMLAKMVERESNVPVSRNSTNKTLQMLPPLPMPGPPIMTNITTLTDTTTTPPTPQAVKKEEVQPTVLSEHSRDPGVSDESWRQLQIAKKQQEDAAIAMEKKLNKIREEHETLDKAMKAAQKAQAEKQLALAAAKDAAERAELMRQREQQRLKEHALRLEQAKREAEIAEIDRQRKEEVRIQAKLRKMGVCAAGFQWIKHPSYYQCAGGSHFINNRQLGL